MSILVINVLNEGLIFGADKSITEYYPDGKTRQYPSSKVLKWPTDKYLFGFVGAAQMGKLPMIEWLREQQHEYEEIDSLEQIAQRLHQRVQEQRNIDDTQKLPEPLVIHLGGFEKKNGIWIPMVWHIGNMHKLGRFDYLDTRHEFFCREEFWANETIKNAVLDPSEVRRFLKVLAKQFNPFWFHQGLDLFTFNVMQGAIQTAFRNLCQQHPEHDIPTTLEEWEKHVMMQVLMYGAYFESFQPVGKRYVGGGADIISTPWPE